MAPKFRVIEDPQAKRLVLLRHQVALEELRAQGFTSVACYTEIAPPLSAIYGFLIVRLMRSFGELVSVRRDLGFEIDVLLMVHPEQTTFVLVNAAGKSFYTGFADGTVLVSTTMHNTVSRYPEEQVYRYGIKGMKDPWGIHQEKIAELAAEGKEIAPGTQFGDYVQISDRADEVLDPGMAKSLLASPIVRGIFIALVLILGYELRHAIIGWLGPWIERLVQFIIPGGG